MATPSVLVFATGGTIGMHETDAGLASDPDFPEVLERLVAGICRPLRIEARINHLLPAIDSANADAETAPRIARAISARVRTHKPRGVVILHGTDTLAHTAARLAFELSGIGSPVVVTGSQLPHGAPRTDAVDNLTLAIRASVKAAPQSPVSVAFGGAILPAVRAVKHDSVSLSAFRAERPLAPNAAGVPAAPSGQDSPAAPARVISFRFTPAVTAADLRAAVGGRPDGLVLECYGSGNAPMARPGMLGTLREVCASMPVVAVTQCATGGVDLARYAVGRELAAAGTIDGSDLTLEAAAAKLGFLLDRGHRGAELRSLMESNLVGELVPDA
ncbi:asparaginase domain-containing protein [Leucobacter tenebrionis]|uniref:asparaginase domain-containing protein n=1 Tax=Leucobacter tenebrionis TaxID=2873270 RepID=UPI00210414E6|nr:asparaginase domain-containing protein [Leucobacter tenebrionis]